MNGNEAKLILIIDDMHMVKPENEFFNNSVIKKVIQ